MSDEDFLSLLGQFLTPKADPNPEMRGVRIVWVRDRVEFGSLHIQQKHNVTEAEVEEVLLRIPPYVKAKRLMDKPERTAFWGATDCKRWLVVICDDFVADKVRCLQPNTAFEPDEDEEYWRKL